MRLTELTIIPCDEYDRKGRHTVRYHAREMQELLALVESKARSQSEDVVLTSEELYGTPRNFLNVLETLDAIEVVPLGFVTSRARLRTLEEAVIRALKRIGAIKSRRNSP